MATKKQQSKNTNTKKWWTRRGARIIIIILVILAVTFGINWIKNIYQSSAEATKMATYLRDKYGEEFVVSKPTRKASGFGVEGYLEANAHPEQDPTLNFLVRSSSIVTKDEYAGAVWQREELKRLIPIVKKMFGIQAKISLQIRTAFTFEQQPIQIHGSIPSFKEGVDKYGHKIIYNVSITSKDPITDADRTTLSNHIYEFMQNMNPKTNRSFSYSVGIERGRRYGVSLDDQSINTINNAGELEKLFKTWRVQ